MTNKKLLKNLLATASMTAMILSGVEVANAAVVTAVATTPLDQVAGGFTNGDTLKYGSDGYTVTLDGANGVNTIAAIQANGKISRLDVTGSDGSVGSINGGAGKLTLNITTGNTLTLTGTAGAANSPAVNVYTGLGAITLSNPTATLLVQSAGAVSLPAAATINGNAANDGVLKIDATNGTVGILAAVGANQSLASIDIVNATKATTFTGAATAAALNITNGALANSIVFTGGLTTAAVTSTAGAAVTVNGAITGTGAADLTITTGANALTFANNVTAAGAHNLVFAGAGAGAITLDANAVSGQDITIDGTTHTTTITGTTTATGNIVVTNATNAITFTDTTTAASLNVGAGAGGVTLNNGHTGILNFTADGVVNLGVGANITGNITAANNGTLNVADGNSKITGNIGAVGNAVKKISFAGAGGNTLTINGNVHNLTELDITADGIVSIDNDATIGTVEFYHADSKLTFAGANNTLRGTVVANGANQGILDASANSATVTGNIGDITGNAIAKITIGAANAAQTFTAGGDVHADYVGFENANSELKIGAVTPQTVTITNGTGGAWGVLTTQGANTTTINAAFGTPGAHHFNIVNLNGTGAVTFNGAQDFNRVILGAVASNTTFTNATIITQALNFTADGQQLTFADDATFAAGADFDSHDGTITIQKANGLVAGAIFNAGANNHKGTVVFEDDQVLPANLGGAGANQALKEVQVVNAHTLDATGKAIFSKSITNPGGGATLTVDNYDGIIGDADAFAIVNITTGDLDKLHSTTTNVSGAVNIKGGAKSNFDLTLAASHLNAAHAGADIAGDIKFHNNASKFTIDANTTFANNVTANAAGDGIFEVSGDRNFTGAIGFGNVIGKLDLKTADVFTFSNANVLANDITFAKGATAVVNAADVNFGGMNAAGDLTINLQENTAALAQNAVFNGDLTLQLKIMGPNGADYGFINANGNDIDAGATNNLTIEITDANAAVKGNNFVILQNLGKGSNINQHAKSKCTDTLNTVNFEYDPNTFTITAKADVVALAAAGTGAITAAKKADVEITEEDVSDIFNPENTGSAANVAENLSQMSGEARASAVADLAHTTASATATVVLDTISTVTETLTSRVTDLAMSNFGPQTMTISPSFEPTTPATSNPVTVSGGGAASKSAAPTSSTSGASKSGGGSKVVPTNAAAKKRGVASGDVFAGAELGSWVYGFGGTGVQKKLSADKSGYKSKLSGGSIGLDAKFNEHFLGGLAVTYADVTVNHKDAKKGDSTKAPTWVASAYGLYDFGNNWFTRGVLSYARSKISNKDTRQLTQATKGAAKSSYVSQSGSIDLGGGYRHAINETFNVTPSASIQYTYTQDGGYTETGAADQNLTAKKKKFSNVTANLGASVGAYYVVDDYHIMPELHGAVHQYLGGKKAIVTTSMQGQVDPFTHKQKPTKTSYNLGTSVAVKTGAVEFGAGYDLSLAKKYVGHQGSVKLRVNF